MSSPDNIDNATNKLASTRVTSWADESADEELPVTTTTTSTKENTNTTNKPPATATATNDEEIDPANAIDMATGLHPHDSTAQVSVSNIDASIYRAAASFEELGLSAELLKGVYEMGFATPSKIQAQALPMILATPHPNIIGQAHAGSGKTAAFSLGILSRVNPEKRQAQAVVLVPTRELAIQVADVIRKIAKHTTIEVYTAIPAPKGQKVTKEKVTQQVVVGTPGTIENKLKFRDIDANSITVLVADEADQMISLDGMGDATIRIKKHMKSAQILLFSATFDPRVRAFAKQVVPNAAEISVETKALSLDSIKQFYMNCGKEDNKYDTLISIYSILEKVGQSIIFVNTVATAKMLATRMRTDGFAVSVLHGQDMDREERDRVMDDFRQQKTTVLISTNVIARGIDVLSVTLVVNYDVPLTRFGKPDCETYIHRIGRSGRFGRKGVAINFVWDDKSIQDLNDIAQHFGRDIDEIPQDLEQAAEKVNSALQV